MQFIKGFIVAKRATLADFREHLNSIYPNLFDILAKDKDRFSFRVNLLKATPQEVLDSLKDEGFEVKETIYEDVFTLPISDRKSLPKAKVYTEHKVYIQSLSSIFAARCLEVSKSDWVLDLAAAPGGKSLIFAQAANKVSAVEPDKSRFFSMKRNFKAMGAKNIQTYNKDGRFIYKSCNGWFDKVFLDAPCSSEAHIDIKKGITWWNKRRIYKFAKLQKELIISAFESLKPNGVMVYATCTFAPQENEAVLNFLLSKYPNAKILPIEHNFSNFTPAVTSFEGEEYHPSISNAIRVVPSDEFSGFFFAKIYKA